VDRLAKKALKAGLCTGQYIRSSFPNEQIWITLGGKKLRGLCWQNWKSSGADLPLRDSFTRRGLSHHLILIPFGGLVMAGPCLRTQNPFSLSSQSKYLGGAGAISNYPCGKKK
jgi:hypothetical protein